MDVNMVKMCYIVFTALIYLKALTYLQVKTYFMNLYKYVNQCDKLC